jgi:PhnB protein
VLLLGLCWNTFQIFFFLGDSLMPVTPHLVVNGAAKASEFYQSAFGAEEIMRMPAEDGQRLMHCSLRIAGGQMFLCDDFPEYCGGKKRAPAGEGNNAVTLHLDVPDCDAAVTRAQKAGATVTMPPADMFWGDRYAQVQDPFGHTWSFATPLKK